MHLSYPCVVCFFYISRFYSSFILVCIIFCLLSEFDNNSWRRSRRLKMCCLKCCYSFLQKILHFCTNRKFLFPQETSAKKRLPTWKKDSDINFTFLTSVPYAIRFEQHRFWSYFLRNTQKKKLYCTHFYLNKNWLVKQTIKCIRTT